ncbi:hypothetical protein D1818_05515 [Aquimarina sp. BL5]|uniref:hypothetical protein n=1 Tax=Aquimarina sp. BL5 TaxID=1714860 RepID=UPI000E4E4BB3|nr:hypothetical protein [Aquimarina sp. BL5]AXT50313.1 hypothetical protein D1818_05515 [Aquimarina sp. BL5]RKM89779.1 hypothetical protein D7036_24425 [Aquimarina sp. BL5]
MKSKTNLKYYGIILIGIICFALIYYTYSIVSFANSDIFNGLDYVEVKFDKELWTRDKEERYVMSKDIIESKILVGLNKENVIEILGSDYDSYSENTISYCLGFVPSISGSDPDLLELTFENGKVKSVRQHGT